MTDSTRQSTLQCTGFRIGAGLFGMLLCCGQSRAGEIDTQLWSEIKLTSHWTDQFDVVSAFATRFGEDVSHHDRTSVYLGLNVYLTPTLTLTPGYQYISIDLLDDVLEILESLPREWSGHPLILFRRGSALAAGRKFREALPPLLRACSMWPDDPAPFVSAAWAAIKEETKQGTSEVLRGVRASAPRTARDYRMWTGMEGWLSYAGEDSPMEAFEAKTRPFRGQADLGGHLSPEIKQQPK